MRVDGEGTIEGRETPAGVEVSLSGADPDWSTRADEFAAMRETVAKQYADALGKRYEPPSEDEPDRPRFDKAEVDRHRVASDVLDDRNAYRAVNAATGLSHADADRIADQIRAGAAKGPAADDGRQWHIEVPLTGPNGTITVRTAWMLDAGTDRPRLMTIGVP